MSTKDSELSPNNIYSSTSGDRVDDETTQMIADECVAAENARDWDTPMVRNRPGGDRVDALLNRARLFVLDGQPRHAAAIIQELVAELRATRDALATAKQDALLEATDEIDSAGRSWCHDYGRCWHPRCRQRAAITESLRARAAGGVS